MTLSDAIEHCKEKAEKMRISADLCNLGTEIQSECIKCAEEHEQLAEWLTELKEVHELFEKARYEEEFYYSVARLFGVDIFGEKENEE